MPVDNGLGAMAAVHGLRQWFAGSIGTPWPFYYKHQQTGSRQTATHQPAEHHRQPRYSDTVGVPGLVTWRPYEGICTAAKRDVLDPACAETTYNTRWTAYNDTGYSGAAGAK
jgi:hypothetical protein